MGATLPVLARACGGGAEADRGAGFLYGLNTAGAFLGTVAAGFVLLLRFFFGAVIEVTLLWESVLMVQAALTILYGNLCVIPLRNWKRLLSNSSVANAGYLLLSV